MSESWADRFTGLEKLLTQPILPMAG